MKTTKTTTMAPQEAAMWIREMSMSELADLAMRIEEAIGFQACLCFDASDDFSEKDYLEMAILKPLVDLEVNFRKNWENWERR